MSGTGYIFRWCKSQGWNQIYQFSGLTPSHTAISMRSVMLEGKKSYKLHFYMVSSQSSTFVLDGKAKAAMTFLKNVFLNVLY